jgi:hypothetical protein
MVRQGAAELHRETGPLGASTAPPSPGRAARKVGQRPAYARPLTGAPPNTRPGRAVNCMYSRILHGLSQPASGALQSSIALLIFRPRLPPPRSSATLEMRAEMNRRADERLPGDLLWGSSHQHHEVHPAVARRVKSLWAKELLTSSLALIAGGAHRVPRYYMARNTTPSIATEGWHPHQFFAIQPAELLREYADYRAVTLEHLAADARCRATYRPDQCNAFSISCT